MNEPDVVFPFNIKYVHGFLERSFIDMDEQVTGIDGCNQSYFTMNCTNVVVIANEAMVL